ncbi:MAG: carboxyltransferase domain-containing protein, partial [Variovorax sp.]
MTALSLHPVGEAALCCSVPGPASLEAQQRIWQLAASLGGADGVQDLIPGMNNLTLVFDPLRTDATALERLVHRHWSEPRRRQAPGRLVEIAVRYGGEHGPDLADVAAHSGLPANEVVRRHAQAEYLVYFIGFQPGFAYLGAPRR